MKRNVVVAVACFGLHACAGGGSSASAQSDGERYMKFGDLEVGADYATSMTKINRNPFVSKDHGRRWVNTYANEAALPMIFEEEGTFPVGSIIVKESFEDDSGAPSNTRGPTFVMEKRESGFNPAQNDWWYAIHWANPEGPNASADGKPLYWRTPAPKVNYCFKCHKKWLEHDAVAVAVPDDNLIRSAMEEMDDGVVEEVNEDF
jgi:hypothetical protein